MLVKNLTLRAVAFLLVSAMILSSCSGGSDPGTPASDSTDPAAMTQVLPELGQESQPVSGEVGVVGDTSAPSQQAPDDLNGIERVALIINTENRCSVVGENIDLRISRALTDEEQAAADPVEPPDVTPFVTLTQSLGTSLQLLSRTDELARFSMQRPDVVGLSAELDNGSITTYLAAFAANAPDSAIMRKPVVGGCLYALRQPDYCATGISKSGVFSLSRGEELLISAQGCDLENPQNLPLIDLPAEEN